MIIPEERLKIFISSAQREEDDFVWLDFRKKIKKTLSKCRYLNPFIIEDKVSEINSTQFMIYNVCDSDITVVLIKNDFRYGTSIEIETAMKYNKPLLLYFFGDENENEDVKKLRKNVEKRNCCTYKNLNDTEKADKIILNDVITNVITWYQYKHFNNPWLEEESAALSDISAGNDKMTLPALPSNNEETEVSILNDKYSTPTKNTILYFKSCYGDIFDYLQLSTTPHKREKNQPSKLQAVGTRALKWLVLGDNFIDKNVIEELTDSAKEMYSNTEWYSKRLEAIDYILTGDYDQAIVLENQALDIAKAENQPQWIINDILIDLRNLDISSKDGCGYGGEAQTELNKSETNVFLPISDRFLQNVYEKTTEQEIKLSTAPSGTIFYGSNFEQVINEIENYLFAAIMYGSYTHMYLARLTLARILFKYAKLYSDRELMFGSVKIFLLAGKRKELRNVMIQNWDAIYLDISAKSDELWLLTDNIEKVYKDDMKIVVFQLIGSYLSDSMFDNASKYIYSISNIIINGNSEDYFKCIINSIDRLDNEKTIKSLCNILTHKRFISCNMLSQVIFRLDFTGVSEQQQIIFCNLLSENLEYIFNYNGDPQIIAALIKKNPSVFNSLEEKAEKWITGINKKYYDINSGCGSWLETLQELVEMAKSQFESNRNPGFYSGFDSNPFASIVTIIDEHFSEEMIPVISKELIPLCNDILTSFAVAAEKQKCVDCLCHLVGYYKKHNYSIPSSLLDSIDGINYPERDMYMSFNSSSKESLDCELLMLRVLVGKSDTKDLFQWVIQYSKKELNERMAISESITTYLKYMMGITNIDSILPVVFLCCEDEQTTIKENGCYCLAYLLDSHYYEIVCSKLYEMVLDPSPRIRSVIINLCENNYIADAEVKAKLLSMLVNDADFRIRKNAKKLQVKI